MGNGQSAINLHPSSPSRTLTAAMFDWLQNLFTGNNSPDRRNPLGDRGENVAARFLRNLGYKIIARNFHCGFGEIDIIARDGKALVFVEVKSRKYDDPTPEDQINPTKMHQLTKAATFYLTRYGHPQPPARFDVIAVVWSDGQPPQIRHTADAFQATF